MLLLFFQAGLECTIFLSDCLKLLRLFVVFGLQLILLATNLLQGVGDGIDLNLKGGFLGGYFFELRLVLLELSL